MQYLEEFEIRPESTEQDAAIWQVAWTQHGVVAARASGTVDVIEMKSMLVKTSIKNEHKLGIVALTRSSNDELLLTSSVRLLGEKRLTTMPYFKLMYGQALCILKACYLLLVVRAGMWLCFLQKPTLLAKVSDIWCTMRLSLIFVCR